jgi:signal transduction histidine kinase
VEIGWVEVTVTDTGIGMSQEDIDKLFKIDVHHTTPGTAHETGTGLGLILCQEMVAKNGGQLWVESEENKGTKVTFILPVTDWPYPENEQIALGALKPSPLASIGTVII